MVCGNGSISPLANEPAHENTKPKNNETYLPVRDERWPSSCRVLHSYESLCLPWSSLLGSVSKPSYKTPASRNSSIIASVYQTLRASICAIAFAWADVSTHAITFACTCTCKPEPVLLVPAPAYTHTEASANVLPFACTRIYIVFLYRGTVTICACFYLNIYLCLCKHLYQYIFLCLRTWLCLYICLYLYLHLCTCTLYPHMYLNLYLYLYPLRVRVPTRHTHLCLKLQTICATLCSSYVYTGISDNALGCGFACTCAQTYIRESLCTCTCICPAPLPIHTYNTWDSMMRLEIHRTPWKDFLSRLSPKHVLGTKITSMRTKMVTSETSRRKKIVEIFPWTRRVARRLHYTTALWRRLCRSDELLSRTKYINPAVVEKNACY